MLTGCRVAFAIAALGFQIPPAPAGSIVGRITDSTHSGMSHWIVAARSSTVSRVVRTDRDGRFTIDRLQPGSFTVTVPAQSGFDGLRVVNSVVRSGETTDVSAQLEVGMVCQCIKGPVPGQPLGVQLTLSAIDGAIADAAGEPVPFAVLKISAYAPDTPRMLPLFQDAGGYSDIDGRYRLTAESGVYDLTATFPGFSSTTVSRIRLASDKSTSADFRMMPAGAPPVSGQERIRNLEGCRCGAELGFAGIDPDGHLTTLKRRDPATAFLPPSQGPLGSGVDASGNSRRRDSRGLILDRDAVSERHEPSGNRRDFVAGHDDAHQIERIGGRQRDGFAAGRAVTNGAQRLDGSGHRKLLSDEPAHETTAANFSSCFERAESDQQFAPRREHRFTREQLAEHDAVPAEQHPARLVDPRIGGRFSRTQQRPPAAAVTRT